MKTNFLNSFRRITSKGTYIPEIDGLRFLAILPVVLMHANTNYNRVFESSLQIESSFYESIINQGGKGVWIFFAISGFILSSAFAKHFWVHKRSYESLNLKAYFYRRLTRLEPPFIISTVILYLVMCLFIYNDFNTLSSNLFATLVYMHNVIFGEWSPINPVTWSLEIEVQFYILAPFICALFFKLREDLRSIIIVALICLIPFLVFNESSVFMTNKYIRRTLPTYFHHFLVGIMFSSLYTGSLWNKIRKDSSLWDVICLFSIFMLFYLDVEKTNIISHYAFSLFLFLVLIGAFKGKIVNSLFSNSYIATIGGMCYSIYLLHYAVIFLVMKFSKSIIFQNSILNYSFHMLFSLLAVTVTSLIFFKYFEKPYMRKDWPEKLIDFLTKKRTKFIEK